MKNDPRTRTHATKKESTRKWKQRWKKIVSTLAAVTIFCTTYALILPAITVNSDTYCGFEEHEHTDECYEMELICGMTEGEAEGTQEASEAEQTAEPKTEKVIEIQEVLVDEGHVHGDSCYEEITSLICGQEESESKEAVLDENENVLDENENVLEEAVEGHTHTEECYQVERNLVCGEEEREPVYEEREVEVEVETETPAETPAEAPVQPEAESHVHTEECYKKVLICGKEEHEHEDECFSNPTLDLETAAVWEKTFENVELTGNWAEDTLAIAETQLGYRESTRNFNSSNDVRRGYTRYGAWWGAPYSDWCAMFIQFCMHYAGVDERLMPGHPYVPTWIENVSRLDNYHAPEGFTPQPGDIMFIDWDTIVPGEERVADHIALVSEVKTKEETTSDGATIEVPTTIITIEGNLDDKVQHNTYKADDTVILGYSKMPVRPATEEELEALAEEAEALLTEGEEAEETEEVETEVEIIDPETIIELASFTESGVQVNFSAPWKVFPEGTVDPALNVVEIPAGTMEYEIYKSQATSEFVDEYAEVKEARFFDITVVDLDGQEIKLNDESLVSVSINFPEEDRMEVSGELSVVHFAEDGAEVLETEAQGEGEIEEVSFETPGFSVFGVVDIQEITSKYISASGAVYDVTVTYGPEAEIPAGATLQLTEYDKDSEEFKNFAEMHREELGNNRAAYIQEETARRYELLQDALAAAELAEETGMEDETVVPTINEIRAQVAAEYDARNNDDNFSVIDITILDAEGNVVEPSAPVSVKILMAEMPEGADGLVMKNSLRVQHYVENNGQIEPETVAMANAGLGEIIVGDEDVTTVEFTVDSFSFYTLDWTPAGQSSKSRFTVYYGFLVDGVFHEFGPEINAQLKYSTANDYDHFNLNVPSFLSGTYFDGRYTFSKAVVRRDGMNGGEGGKSDTQLDVIAGGQNPVITKSNYVGNGSGYQVELVGKGTYKLGNADRIYVIYESPHGGGVDYNYVDKDNPNNSTRGGSALADTSANPVDLGVPKHTKTLEENISPATNLPDNTYELTLTAVGETQESSAHTKADIIFIVDQSGSMRRAPGSGVYSDWSFAVDPLRNTMRDLVNQISEATQGFPEDTVQYSYISFNTNASVRLTNATPNQFKNFINNTLGNDGEWGYATNWEDGLQKLGRINTRADAKQYVVFISDGMPSVRNTRGLGVKQDYFSTNGVGYGTGEWVWATNDGSSYSWMQTGGAGGSYLSGGIYGDTGNHWANSDACYAPVVEYAKNIKNSGVTFFAIGLNYMGSDVREPIKKLANDAGGRWMIASNKNEISSAFSPIMESVIQDYRYEFKKIEDKLAVNASTNLMETPSDFKYYKFKPNTGATGNIIDSSGKRLFFTDGEGGYTRAVYDTDPYGTDSGEPVPMSEIIRTLGVQEWAGAPAATYNSATGTVNWNLEGVTVEDGYIYAVTFTVYPSQQGWDAVADVSNNPSNISKYNGQLYVDDDGTVRIKSNSEAKLTYRQKNTVNDSASWTAWKDTPYPFPEMEVGPTTIKIRKVWMDPTADWSNKTATFKIYRDSSEFATVTLPDTTFKLLDGTNAGKTGIAKVNSEGVVQAVKYNGESTWRDADGINTLTTAQVNAITGTTEYPFIETQRYISPGLKATNPDIIRTGHSSEDPLPGAEGHSYTVYEVTSASGYRNINTSGPSTPFKIDGVMQYAGTAALSATNRRDTGLELTKVNESNANLGGAQFEIWSWDGRAHKALDPTTENGAIFKIDSLEDFFSTTFNAGGYDYTQTRYYIKETSAPEGYQKLETVIPFAIEEGKIVLLDQSSSNGNSNLNTVGDVSTFYAAKQRTSSKDAIHWDQIGAAGSNKPIEVSVAADGTLQIKAKNTPIDNEFEITKRNQDDDRTLTGATFTITKIESADNMTAVAWDGLGLTATDNSGEYVIPENSGVFKLEDIQPGTYIIQETNPPAKYASTISPIVVVVDERGNMTMTVADEDEDDVIITTQNATVIKIKVKNELEPKDFTLLKVGNDGQPLAGATFDVWSFDGRIHRTLTAEADGSTFKVNSFLGGLDPNTYYYIVESGAPTSYGKLETVIPFKFTEDKQFEIVTAAEARAHTRYDETADRFVTNQLRGDDTNHKIDADLLESMVTYTEGTGRNAGTLTVTVENEKPRYPVYIRKTNEDGTVALSGAGFDVRRAIDKAAGTSRAFAPVADQAGIYAYMNTAADDRDSNGTPFLETGVVYSIWEKPNQTPSLMGVNYTLLNDGKGIDIPFVLDEDGTPHLIRPETDPKYEEGYGFDRLPDGWNLYPYDDTWKAVWTDILSNNQVDIEPVDVNGHTVFTIRIANIPSPNSNIKPAYLRLSVKKSIVDGDGNTLADVEDLLSGKYDGKFKFVITGKGDAPMPAPNTAYNEGENVTFEAIKFETAGRFVYEIEEEEGSEPGILYSGDKKTITVVTKVVGANTEQKVVIESVTCDGQTITPVETDEVVGSDPFGATVTSSSTPFRVAINIKKLIYGGYTWTGHFVDLDSNGTTHISVNGKTGYCLDADLTSPDGNTYSTINSLDDATIKRLKKVLYCGYPLDSYSGSIMDAIYGLSYNGDAKIIQTGDSYGPNYWRSTKGITYSETTAANLFCLATQYVVHETMNGKTSFNSSSMKNYEEWGDIYKVVSLIHKAADALPDSVVEDMVLHTYTSTTQPAPDGRQYQRIGALYIPNTVQQATVETPFNNTLTSELTVDKKVVDYNHNALSVVDTYGETFKFELTIAKGGTTPSSLTYYVKDPAGNILKSNNDPIKGAGGVTLKSNNDSTSRHTLVSGDSTGLRSVQASSGVFEINIKDYETLVFTNLPIGATWTLSETSSGSNFELEGYIVNGGAEVNSAGGTLGTNVSSVEVHNKQRFPELALKKVDANGEEKTLEGAGFQIWVDKAPKSASVPFINVFESDLNAGDGSSHYYNGRTHNFGRTCIETNTYKNMNSSLGAGGQFLDDTGFIVGPDKTTRLVNGNNKWLRYIPSYNQINNDAVKNANKTFYSDAQGIVNFGMLPDGEYYIIETVAPDGYKAFEEPIKIKVEGGVVTLLTPNHARIGNGKEITSENANGNTVYTITVTNAAGDELPETGGIGTTILYVLGSILVIGAGVLLIARRKNK